MSDTHGPDQPGWGPDGSGADDQGWASPPPPPPPPPPPTESPPTLDSETEVSSGGSGIGGRVAAGVIGVLLLLGGSVFAVTELGSSGPDSAEAAVDELLAAAGDEDVLGVLATLDPSERDTLRDSVESMFGDLERLEVVDDAFELSGIDGVDLVFSDITYRTEPVRDDLTRVYLTGGSVTAGFNSDEVPIGDFVHDTVERFDGDISGVQESETTEISPDDEMFLVARDGDDGWRVSIAYTLAELAREDAGQPVPTNPLEPVGADSPEAAVEGMAHALADLDLTGAIARLSPEEFGALQEYADLYLADVQAGAEDARAEADITIHDLGLRSDVSGDRATVFVDSLDIEVAFDGEQVRFATDGECFTFEGDAETFGLFGMPADGEEICSDDLTGLQEDMFEGMGPAYDDMFEGGELPEFPEFETPEIGITTRQIDGAWYVAPIATGMDAWVAALEVLEREHLDAMVDYGEAFFGMFFYGFDGGSAEFEEIGREITTEETIVPAPTTTVVGGQGGTTVDPRKAPGPVDEAALEEFVTQFAFDEAQAECILGELGTRTSPYVRWELADSYANDYIPSSETQDAFFFVLDACP